MPSLAVAGTYNARSVAAPWLIRTAALDTLTPHGAAQLRALGVALVVDLREDSERTSAVHDFPVVSVPLYRSGPPKTGHLEDIYEFLLTQRKAELSRAVIEVARAPGPALVHCTAGKDRTGLVVALCLLASGHDDETVLADYEISGPEVRPHRERTVDELLSALDLPAHARQHAQRLHLESPRQAMEHALRIIDSAGGVERYLRDGGATVADIDVLVQKAQQ